MNPDVLALIIVSAALLTGLFMLVLKWVDGIDYMDKHHPDYKGDDLFGDDRY